MGSSGKLSLGKQNLLFHLKANQVNINTAEYSCSFVIGLMHDYDIILL